MIKAMLDVPWEEKHKSDLIIFKIFTLLLFTAMHCIDRGQPLWRPGGQGALEEWGGREESFR